MIKELSLKEFIKQSLVDICEGVTEASQLSKKIAPQVWAQSIAGTHGHKNDIITFDIAVTASEANTVENKAGIGAKISVVQAFIGQKDKSAEQSSSVSRIKFSVPVYFEVAEEN